MPISLPCTNLHTALLTQYNPFLNGQLTRETKYNPLFLFCQIVIKDANEMRGICA